MNDYHKQIREHAKAIFEMSSKAFAESTEEHGGKSEKPNFALWLDERGTLVQRIEEVSSKWTHKDFLWVKSNTRSKPQEGGDPRSNAFASFLRDVRQELKKLERQS